MTIGEFLAIYEREHVAFLKNRLGTSQRLHRYLAPFTSIPLPDLTRLQVVQWFHEIARTAGPQGANLALQQLHALYEKAKEWEVYEGKNPADRVKKFPKTSRTRFVQPEEMPALFGALAQESSQVETFFLCLLLTGARLNEARTMKWSDLDLVSGLWHKPITKTGTPHTVPLAPALVRRLQQLPHKSEFVFMSRPNVQNGFHPRCWSRTAVQWTWRRIRRRASLSDLRIHDLRRSTASWLASGGENLAVIQRVLNHTTLAVTQVYARLQIDSLRRALEGNADRMLRLAQVPRIAGPRPRKGLGAA